MITQAVKLHENFDHFKYTLRMKTKNIWCEYSSKLFTPWLNQLVSKQLCIKMFGNHRVLKCDIIKKYICNYGILGGVLWKNNRQKVYISKISIPGQIVFEIIAQLCSDDSIQILLNLSQFTILGIKSNLKGFVWSHQSKMGLVSPRQFAPQC